MLDHSFSLTKALHTAIARSGRDVDDVHAVLGLSMCLCTHPAYPYPAQWSAYARDARIVQAASALGACLRALHPPEAATGLNGASEFAQHFQASYRPLVLHALQNQQPVLAWQGWPGEDRLSWGLITGESNGDVGLTGMIWTEDHAGQWRSRSPLVLDTPPVQVYIVESVGTQPGGGSDLLRCAVSSALVMLGPATATRFGVLTGSGAVAFWMGELRKRGGGSMAPTQATGHQQLAASISRSVKSALRFLKKRQEGADERIAGPLNSVIAACTMVGHHLRELSDPMASRRLLTHPEGIAKALRDLAEVKLAQINLLAALQSLDRALVPVSNAS
ncbi:MAG: hypothetical protein ACE5E5_09690 [Phycisphaerae bacterium]